MFQQTQKVRGCFVYKTISLAISVFFLLSTVATPGAASTLNLPAPGTMVGISAPHASTSLAGMTIYPNEPMRLSFIVDSGDDGFEGEKLKAETQKLINYFLATLTVPEDEMWVNLSPYEKDRIIANGLGQTEMGRDMLVQDYILKQLTASLMYPEEEIGSDFWKRIYAKTQAQFGTTDIPTNTFNKVWIVPETAGVFVNGTNVFISERKFKVMLEEDYIALENNVDSTKHGLGDVALTDIEKVSEEAKGVIREVILPEIEWEVNHGENFANLRQIYDAMILATWYKKNLKNSFLGAVYMDVNKTKGIELDDPNIKEEIYNQYIAAFKKGVYDYVKEEYDSATEEMIPRKYFSGGLEGLDRAKLTDQIDTERKKQLITDLRKKNLTEVDVLFDTDEAAIVDAPMDQKFYLQEGAFFLAKLNAEMIGGEEQFFLNLSYVGQRPEAVRSGSGVLIEKFPLGANKAVAQAFLNNLRPPMVLALNEKYGEILDVVRYEVNGEGRYVSTGNLLGKGQAENFMNQVIDQLGRDLERGIEYNAFGQANIPFVQNEVQIKYSKDLNEYRKIIDEELSSGVLPSQRIPFIMALNALSDLIVNQDSVREVSRSLKNFVSENLGDFVYPELFYSQTIPEIASQIQSVEDISRLGQEEIQKGLFVSPSLQFPTFPQGDRATLVERMQKLTDDQLVKLWGVAQSVQQELEKREGTNILTPFAFIADLLLNNLDADEFEELFIAGRRKFVAEVVLPNQSHQNALSDPSKVQINTSDAIKRIESFSNYVRYLDKASLSSKEIRESLSKLTPDQVKAFKDAIEAGQENLKDREQFNVNTGFNLIVGYFKDLDEDEFQDVWGNFRTKRRFLAQIFLPPQSIREAIVQQTLVGVPTSEAQVIMDGLKNAIDEVDNAEIDRASIDLKDADIDEQLKEAIARTHGQSVDGIDVFEYTYNDAPRYISISSQGEIYEYDQSGEQIYPALAEAIRNVHADTSIREIKYEGVNEEGQQIYDSEDEFGKVTRYLVSEGGIVTQEVDQAAINPGGIDFNPAAMDFIQSGQSFRFDMNASILELIQPNAVEGVRPQIIQIVPLTNVSSLLGG